MPTLHLVAQIILPVVAASVFFFYFAFLLQRNAYRGEMHGPGQFAGPTKRGSPGSLGNTPGSAEPSASLASI